MARPADTELDARLRDHQYASDQLRLEGIELPDDMTALVRRIDAGEISVEDAIAELDARTGKT